MVSVVLIGSKALYAYEAFQRGIVYIFTHPSFVLHVAVGIIFLFVLGLLLFLRNLGIP
jgi:hypothetical protein